MADPIDRSVLQVLEALRSVLEQAAEPKLLLKTLLSQAVRVTGADRGVFVEVDDQGRLSFRVLYKFETDSLTGRAGDFSRNVLARVMREGRPALVSNAQESPELMTKDSVINLRLVSVLCMPIHLADKVAAMIHLESDIPEHFNPEHERLLSAMLRSAAPALAALRANSGVVAERDRLRVAERTARAELQANREQLAHDWSFSRFVGRSAAIKELELQVRKASRTEFPVLLEGETGTGKSILARVLHHSGSRATRSFVTVFCPSLERGMVESELFGHKRGAFTSADGDREGKLQTAEGGSIFLDEIGELPLEIQPKLLRLLQEKTYERIGDSVERSADVRVIAATNRDLRHEVAERRFREDLYNRLNFLPIRIPPVRARREDIPLLLEHCLSHYDAGRWVSLTDEALQALVELEFTWPGNVRHLEQLAARLATEQPEDPVGPDELARYLDVGSGGGGAQVDTGGSGDLTDGLSALMREEERKWLRTALERYPDLKRSELAAILKIGEATLYKKLKEYDL